MKFYKKDQAGDKLAQLEASVATHDNALIRTDATELIGEIRQLVSELVEPADADELQQDYASVRQFILDERKMRDGMADRYPERKSYWARKVGECDSAGMALNRLVKALGLEAPTKPQRPPMEQQKLISVPSREVVS